METWEKDLNENMESIRNSFDSIQRSYNIIMGLMILWIGIEIGMML
jgi:hypothetical protein|tara:strand:- start:1290 stop:1427 length:138 start_codon:yes stop_codon:yes gene_type:complete